MKAAGHLHPRHSNGHQWAEEVAMPKPADSHRGGSGELVENLTTKTFEKMSPDDWTTRSLSVAPSEQPMSMRRKMPERTSHEGCLTQHRQGRVCFHPQLLQDKP